MLKRIFSTKSEDVINLSKTFKDAPTTAGASVFENKYGRPFCRNVSITSFGPDVYPPVPPPYALPNVELIISTFTSKCSSVPRPVAPKKPVA